MKQTTGIREASMIVIMSQYNDHAQQRHDNPHESVMVIHLMCSGVPGWHPKPYITLTALMAEGKFEAVGCLKA